MVDLVIELDDRQLQAWAAQAVPMIKRQLRSAVDRSARYARQQTVPVLAADSNVPLQRFRAAVPLVKSSTAASLEARWTLSSSNNFLRGPGGAVLSPAKGQSVTGSTFATTGGGSASLTLGKVFSLGGRGVFVRTGKGRTAIKGIYAESPASAFRQENSAPRRTWTEAGERSLALLAAAGVAAALNAQSSAPMIPGMPTGDVV